MSNQINNLRRCLFVSAMASAILFSQLPAAADTTGTAAMGTINSFLSSLAIKNGMIAPTSSYIQTLTSQSTPSTAQALTALHQLPAPVHYSNATHTPDPTLAELPFVQPGATDADGNLLADPTPGLLFGTITPGDQTLTGMFDDLTALPAQADPTELDPTLLQDPVGITALNISDDDQTLRRLRGQHEAEIASAFNLFDHTLKFENNEIAMVRNSQLFAASPSNTGFINVANSAVVSVPMSFCDEGSSLIKEETAGNVQLTILQGLNACAVVDVNGTSDAKAIKLQGFVQENNGSNEVVIDNGAATVEFSKPSTVNTPHAGIAAGHGSVVSFEVAHDSTKVRHCGGNGKVSITFGNQQIALNPGEEAIISNSSEAAQQALADGIAKRRVQTVSFAGTQVVISEFSIASFISATHINRGNSMYERMLKTAAALQVITRGHGRYTTVANNP